MPVATNLGRVIAYNEDLSSIEPQNSLIKWSFEVT